MTEQRPSTKTNKEQADPGDAAADSESSEAASHERAQSNLEQKSMRVRAKLATNQHGDEAREVFLEIPEGFALPFTHPDILERLEQIDEGRAAKILDQVDRDAIHNRRMEFYTLIGAVLIALIVIAAALVLAFAGRQLAAVGIAAVAFGGIGVSGLIERLRPRSLAMPRPRNRG